MAVFVLQDLQGSVEVVLFPEALAQNDNLLEVDKILFVRGKVDCRRELPNIIANQLIALDDVGEQLTNRVNITLQAAHINEQKVKDIRNVCSMHKGQRPVYVTVVTDKGLRISAIADRNLMVRPDVEFCKKMKQLVGPENFVLSR